MTFVEDRWVLTVEFDSIQEMGSSYEGGPGEAAEFYAYIRKYWVGMDEDALDESTELVGDTVRAATNLLDSLDEVFRWLFVWAVPKSIKLERMDSR
jgi:hypothetical protein